MRVPLSLLILAACAPEPTAPVRDEAPTSTTSVAQAFDDAERAYDVPAALLAALADAETGIRTVHGEPEHEGRPTACGVTALKSDVLAEAAALAGVTTDAACDDVGANVAAAAALLDVWADEVDLDRDDLGAWASLVVRWSEITVPEAQASFVHEAVYARIRRGVVVDGVRFGKIDVEPEWPAPTERRYVDASGVVWRPSPNFNSRAGHDVLLVVVHTCESSYASCWGWLTDPESEVSAHYVVDETGSEVSQLVLEADRAWHVGASYDCTLDDDVRCDLNGTNVNYFAVGIEHAGYASSTSWDPGEIERSAELLCDIARANHVPIDDTHVVGHGRLQPYNRTDPGAGWPWADYLARARAACGETEPERGATLYVIDSDDAANVPGQTEIVTSETWTSSAAPGSWNDGTLRAPTSPTSDPAHFRFRLDAPTCVVVDAWWPEAADQLANATFLAYDPSGTELGRATVDQRVGGSRWNALGTWTFDAGWNEIALSRWAPEGSFAAADAVRLTSCDAAPVDTDVPTIDDTDAPAPVDDSDVTAPVDSDTDATPSTSGCGCATSRSDPVSALLLIALGLSRRQRPRCRVASET